MEEFILPQIVAIGLYNSSVAVKNKTITKNRKTTMFEIELPIEKGGISFIDAEQFKIETDKIVCAKPGQIRHTILPYKCYYIHMILTKGELYDILMNIPSFMTTTMHLDYQVVFEALYKNYGTESDHNIVFLQSRILELIYMLSKDYSLKSHTERSKAVKQEVIENAVEYIDGHISEDLSLGSVSKNVSYSSIHFHNCFKAATGKTLREYVEEQRIKKALTLLTTTNLTLTQIAYQCGFSSQAYFSYVFKKRMNITPREYAKEKYRIYTI